MSRRPRRAPSWSRPSPSASAAPTGRSSPGTTAGRRPASDRLVLGHESLGRVLGATRGHGLQRRRPRGRHRPAARPGALPELRGRRVGHVPQRPVHRARHQGARRLRPRALAHRARASRSGSTRCSGRRRAAGADQRRRQGVGAHRADRPRAPLGAADRPGHRRRADRSAGRAAGPCSAGWRSTSWTAATDGPKPRPGPGARRDVPHRRRSTTSDFDAGRGDRVHRRADGGPRDAMRKVGPDGDRLPDRGLRGGRTICVDIGQLNREMVLENNVVFGSVNANRRHCETGRRGARRGPTRPGSTP